MGNTESAQGAWLGGWLIGALLAPVTGGASLIASAAVVTGSTVALAHHNEQRTPPSSNQTADRLIGFVGGGIGAVAGGAPALGANASVSVGLGSAAAVTIPISTQQPSPAALSPQVVRKPTPAQKPTPAPTTPPVARKPTPAAPTAPKILAQHPSSSRVNPPVAPAKIPQTSVATKGTTKSVSATHVACSKLTSAAQLERCTVNSVKFSLDSGGTMSEAGVAVRDSREQHAIVHGSSSDGKVHAAYTRTLRAPLKDEVSNVRATSKFGSDHLYLQVSSDARSTRVEVGGRPAAAALAVATISTSLAAPVIATAPAAAAAAAVIVPLVSTASCPK